MKDELLEKIKIELDIVGNALDAKLTRYIDKAIVIIRNYLKNPELEEDFILDNYGEAIIAIACRLNSISKYGGIKSQTLGKKSITYIDSYGEGSIIDNTIKLLLPIPSAIIKMFH